MAEQARADKQAADRAVERESAPETGGPGASAFGLQRIAGNRSTLAMLGIQRKLDVGAADDPSEAAADRFGEWVERVWREPGNSASPPPNGSAPQAVERAIQRATDSSPDHVGPEGGVAPHDVVAGIDTARGSGTALPPELVDPIMRRVGVDVGGVRIHQDALADRLNRQMQAKAFTVGTDIFFRRNHYAPDRPEGRRLLGHELGHVVQQDGGVTAQRTVRRYVGPTLDYTLASEEGASTPFSSFQDDPSVIDRPSESGDTEKPGGVGFAKSTPNHPPLFVAGDGSIAINSQKGESKEFYATDKVFREANEALEAMGSPIELVKDGNKITVGGKVLEMARPKLRGKDTPAKDEFVSLMTDICRDVASKVMGLDSSPNVVKLKGKSAPSASGDSIKLGGTHEIAKTMVEGGSLNDALEGADNAAAVDDAPKIGKEYGTKLGKGELDAKAKELEVNQFAKAKIGEAYATQRISNPEGTSESKDFSRPGSEEKTTWGYHFAAVVATSLDGKDQVTLENYNRASQYREARGKLIVHLQTNFAEEVEAIKEKLPDVTVSESLGLMERAQREKTVDRDRQKWIGMVLDRVKTGLDDNESRWKQAYDQMAQETLRNQFQRWYFRMVGEDVGQSFHEQMVSSGTFANPLTVVMGKSVTGGPVISFKEGQTTLTPVEKDNVKRWAGGLPKDKDRGVDLRLQVTGYASGEGAGTKKRAAKNAEKTARERANSVRDELLANGVEGGQIEVRIGQRQEKWTAAQARRAEIKAVHT